MSESESVQKPTAATPVDTAPADFDAMVKQEVNNGQESAAETSREFSESQLLHLMLLNSVTRQQGGSSATAELLEESRAQCLSRRRRFKCAECNRRFASWSRLETHMMTHDDDSALNTAEIQTTLSSGTVHSSNSDNKTRRENNTKDVKSAKRDQSLSTAVKSTKHDGDTRERPYLCMMCPKQFTAACYLRAHIKRHVETDPAKKQHRCVYCGRCFARKSTLDNHVRVHTGERPYSCDACGKTYKHSAGLWQHMAQTHRGLPRRRRPTPAVPATPRRHRQPTQHPASYTCPVCSKVYTNAAGLHWHRRTQHLTVNDEVPLRFPCTDCGQTYGSLRYLKVHQLTHAGVKRFACPVCGRLHITSSRLSAHLRTHSEEKHYGCSECGRLFKQKRGLMTHLRRHTGFHPFICTVCGKQFISEGGIRYHNRIHARSPSDQKPYCCPDCGKGFLSADGLKYHRRLHNRANSASADP